MPIFKHRPEDLKETGFGSKVYEKNQRLMNKDGSTNVQRRGLPFLERLSIYHSLINMSWSKFNLLVLLVYLVANLFFASLYYLIGMNELNGVVGTSNGDRF